MKVSTIDNQFWLSLHYYVVQNWVRIPILISLNMMLEGSSSDNLTKVIMEALTIGGGLQKYQIAQKLICFGVDGVNVFKGTKMVLQNKVMTLMPLIILGSIIFPITLIWLFKHCHDCFGGVD